MRRLSSGRIGGLIAGAIAVTSPVGAADCLAPTTPVRSARQAHDLIVGHTLIEAKRSWEKYAAEKTRLAEGTSRPWRSSALEPETATSLAARAVAAASTDIEGAEAGVSFVVFTKNTLKWNQEVSATLAVLKDEQIRLGTGWSLAKLPDLDPARLGLGCSRPHDLTEAIRAAAAPFEEVCDKVVAIIPAPPQGSTDAEVKARNHWHRARVACGLEHGDPAQGVYEPGGGLDWTDAWADISDAVEEGAKRLQCVASAKTASSVALDTLSRAKADRVYSCNTDDEKADERIRRSIVQAAWAETKDDYAVQGFVDFFPHKWGLNPDADTTTLPRGQLKRWEARTNWNRSRARISTTLGVGVGSVREDVDSNLYAYLSPSLSMSIAAWDLTRVPLTGVSCDPPHAGQQVLNVLPSGDPPPHVVLGFEATAEYALSKPSTQTTSWNKVEFGPFADFKVSGKLSFRIASPVKAEIAVQKEDRDKNIAERRSLQWDFPVTVVTVFKP
jgi:hypothetical protein